MQLSRVVMCCFADNGRGQLSHVVTFFSLANVVIRLVTSRHMRCAGKKEHLDMMTGKPGLPVSEQTLRVFGLRRTSPAFQRM